MLPGAGTQDFLNLLQREIDFLVLIVEVRRKANAGAGAVVDENVAREQFEDELRALTDAEQDSNELKPRKRATLVERIQEELRPPFPGGAGEHPSAKGAGTKNCWR